MIEKYWGADGQKWVWPLKLAVSQKGMNGINWFLDVDKNSGMPKVTLMIFGLW